MKRFAAIAAVLLLTLGAGVVCWQPEVEETPVVQKSQKPSPKRKASAVPLPVAADLPATIAGGVHHQGKGIAGARVIAKSETGLIEGVTGEGGGFLLTLPPDSYLVSAVHEALASPVVGPLQVSAAVAREGLVLELLASATIDGVVLNEQTREPIAKATVSFAGGGALTTANGRFTLKGVSVGEAWLRVWADGFVPRMEWVTVDVARRLSGMEIVLSPAATVRGTVTRGGEPVASARVWAEADSRSVKVAQGGFTVTDARGVFELHIAVGKARLAAAAPNEARVEGPLLTLADGATVDGVRIELGQQLIAVGVVTLDGDLAPHAQLSVFEARSGKLSTTALADAAGRFEVVGLPPGSYLVHARIGGVEGQRGPFALTGFEDEPWNVVLERAGTVRGRVVPAKTGTRVWLKSSDWVGSGAQTLTDAEGRFLFEGVTTESTVEAEGDEGYAQARAQPNEEVVLTLERTVIKGSVVNEHGRAVTDFSIRLRPLSGGASRTHAVLSPTGTFALQTAPGDYEVSAFSPGAAWAEPVRGTAAAGGRAPEVLLKLTQTTAVSGRFVDSKTQAPVAGVDVQVRIGGPFSAVVFASTVTDSQGQFQFSSAPLSAGLVAFAAGYKPRYLTAQALQKWKESIPLERGEAPEWLQTYEGVGLSWANGQPTLTVERVFPGSPAEEAGVLPGDVLISVMGRAASELNFNQIIEAIRGPAGTAVRLGFLRNNAPYEVSVRRRAISL